MGKIKKGILGGFNGRVGNVIGGSWKGVAYMRSEAQSIKNPRTDLQQDNRTLFGQVSDMMSRAKSAVDLGFAGDTSKKSAFNSAVQTNMKYFVDSEQDFEIHLLQFSKGNMMPLAGGSAAKANSTITATFNVFEAPTEDLPVCVVFVAEGSFTASPFVSVAKSRVTSGSSSGTATFTVPAGMTYDTIDVFAFSYDETNRNASTTLYVGNVSGS